MYYEHIIIVALSEMIFPFGTLVATPMVSGDIAIASTMAEESMKKKIEQIKDLIQRHFMSRNDTIMLVPAEISKHWGICIASVEEGLENIY